MRAGPHAVSMDNCMNSNVMDKVRMKDLTAAHEALVKKVAEISMQAGQPLNWKPADVPPCSEASEDRGDLVTTRFGLVDHTRSHSLHARSRMVLDATLVHTQTSSGHSFKSNNLDEAESAKYIHYQERYLQRGIALLVSWDLPSCVFLARVSSLS